MVTYGNGLCGLITIYPFENRVYGKPHTNMYSDELASFAELASGLKLSEWQKDFIGVINDNNP